MDKGTFKINFTQDEATVILTEYLKNNTSGNLYPPLVEKVTINNDRQLIVEGTIMDNG